MAVGLVEQQIYGGAIDQWFDKISEGLTEKQRADLKRKFSRIDALAKTGQSIRAKAFDVSEHYRQYWRGTGFKAQLVAPSKASAIRFKEALDEIGHVTSDVIISGPDDREGNEEIDKEYPMTVARTFSLNPWVILPGSPYLQKKLVYYPFIGRFTAE